MTVPVTAFYSGLLALVILGLAYNVSCTRRREKIGLGDDNNVVMRVALRIHGNAIEILPIAILLMLVYELNGGNSIVLHGIGITLVLGRILHFQGLSRGTGKTFGRYWGTAITWVSVAGLAGINVYAYLIS
ncbi:MAG: MAPEG family protein [Gammaproteobacteria bacterium]